MRLAVSAGLEPAALRVTVYVVLFNVRTADGSSAQIPGIGPRIGVTVGERLAAGG